MALQLIDDELGFLDLVIGLVNDGRIAGFVLGPKRLVQTLRRLLDHSVGDTQDRLGRSVILLQANHLRLRMVALEVQDVADIGRPPGVDRLVGVADNGQVSGARRPCTRQPVLHQVGVLEFVDEHVPVTVLVAVAHLRDLLE